MNQKGVGTLLPLFLVSAVGFIVYILVTNTFNFGDNLFSQLFPKISSRAASSTDTSYNLGVLVIKYFPLSSDGQNIDINVTGDVGESYTTIRQRTVDVTNNLKLALEKGSRYLGYRNAAALQALTYQIVDTKEYTQAVPTKNSPIPRYPDYNGIMTTHNICDFVDNRGVREVWLWAYQGPNKSDGYPHLSISESKMAGPFGDISNSPRYNDMPICRNTYRVYTYNYGRFTAEAMESWGHQIEAEISAVDVNLFRNLWQGPNYPQTLGVNGRCGSVHNPPNARSEYDRANPNPQNSDCLEWKPDGLGTLSAISCQNWGCSDIDPVSNNAALNYMIWNWQNLPGRGNIKTYLGKQLRNWWDVHGNFDQVMGSDKTLTISNPSPTPTPNTGTRISDSFNRPDNNTSLGNSDTGESWIVIRGTWGISANTAYPVNDCPAPGYAVIDSGVADGTVQVTVPINPQDVRISFRVVDENNLYWVERRGGTPSYYDINKMVAGVRSVLATTAGTIIPRDGDVIKITLSGSSITVYINGANAMSVNDTSISSTKHGIGTWCGGAVRFDDFSIDKGSTVPSPSPTPTPTPTPSPTPSPTPTSSPVVNGTITGTITSSAGGVISGAKVSLVVNGLSKIVYTSSSGTYSIGNLPPAIYSVTYSAKQHITQIQSVIMPSGTTVVRNVTLRKNFN